jgi:ribosome biogenesis GTPase A
MVVGVPNVGKSSLLNSLRGNNLGFKKAAKEGLPLIFKNKNDLKFKGARPGVTIRVQNRVRIWDKPAIYILDTPGILDPYFDDVDSAMKLAACNLILEVYSIHGLYFVNLHLSKKNSISDSDKTLCGRGLPSFLHEQE